MQRILLVVDSSCSARRAVSVVVELALRTRASVAVFAQPASHAAHALPGWNSASVAQYALKRLVSAGIDAVSSERDQSVVAELSDVVSSFSPDLMVIPADERGEGPGLELLQRINVAFLVVGPRAADTSIGNSVAVGLMDGSDIESTIGGAAEIASLLDAHVLVMHARALAPRVSTFDVELDLVEQAVAKLRRKGIAATGRVLPQAADSAGAIGAAAEAEGAGLIVVNARRIRGLRAWLGGNVAGKLVRSASRPVLLAAKRAA